MPWGLGVPGNCRQGGDSFFSSPSAEAPVAMPSAPVTSAALQCSQQLTPLSRPMLTALSPIKKRRRSEMSTDSQSGAPRSLETRIKRQRRGGKEAETPKVTQNPGSPCLKAAAQAPPVSPVPSCYTSKICPPTVTKSRVPLAVSAAQNCCTLPAVPVHDLNVTFDVSEDGRSPSAAELVTISLSEFPVWDNIQSLQNKQDGPVVPR